MKESNENEINTPVCSSQLTGEPKSAHSTSVVAKYVEKRKRKAEKQTDKEQKTDTLWSAMKYVIL